MKPSTIALRRIAALAVIVIVIGGVVIVAPSGVFSQSSAQSSGVDTPTPSNDGGANDPYDCDDFDTAAQARAVFASEAPDDTSGLDTNDNGIPCEDDFPDQSGPVNTGEPTANAEAATPTATSTQTPTATATETPTETTTATPTETQTETTEEPQTQTKTTEEPQTQTQTTTETETPEETEQPTTTAIAENETAYYQVDFVRGAPIENLRGSNGTYTNDQLIRFAHGSTNTPIMRRSEGEFTTNDSLAARIESHNITVANGTATTTFTVADGKSVTLTLASYQKVGPGWSPETEAKQEFVDADTDTFGPGTYTLSVDLPHEGTNTTA